MTVTGLERDQRKERRYPPLLVEGKTESHLVDRPQLSNREQRKVVADLTAPIMKDFIGRAASWNSTVTVQSAKCLEIPIPVRPGSRKSLLMVWHGYSRN